MTSVIPSVQAITLAMRAQSDLTAATGYAGFPVQPTPDDRGGNYRLAIGSASNAIRAIDSALGLGALLPELALSAFTQARTQAQAGVGHLSGYNGYPTNANAARGSFDSARDALGSALDTLRGAPTRRPNAPLPIQLPPSDSPVQ